MPALRHMRTFSKLRATSALPAKAVTAYPADDDGIKMIECQEKPVNEPNTVQALVHVDAETYWIAFLIASIKSFPRNGFCKNATGPTAET